MGTLVFDIRSELHFMCKFCIMLFEVLIAGMMDICGANENENIRLGRDMLEFWLV